MNGEERGCSIDVIKGVLDYCGSVGSSSNSSIRGITLDVCVGFLSVASVLLDKDPYEE